MPNLYIVATPIGNLKDITLRALEILESVDFILAEDTRQTRKLLAHYDIHTPLFSYHEHSEPRVYEKILSLLKSGKNLALVTDSGTPGISDPGAKLINFIIENLPEAKIIPIPGPSALTAALSVAGIQETGFVFLGFPPHKKGRKTFFEDLKKYDLPIVIYESPHRITRAIDNLQSVFGPDKKIVIARELTKIHEEILRGTISEIREKLTGEKQRGEFAVII